MKHLLIAGIALFFASCGGGSSKTENTDSTKTSENKPTAAGLADGKYAYLYVNEKDSSFLNIEVKGGNITGDMTFQPEVSDGAYGTITGTQTGNKIKAEYSYEIEGSKQAEAFFAEVQGTDFLWKRYELKEDPATKMMVPDTTKYVDTQKFVLRK